MLTQIVKLIIILDIPTPSHIASLVDSFERSSFYRKLRSNHPDDLAEVSVRSVFHICGEGVLEDERYGAFMRGFSSETEVEFTLSFLRCYLILVLAYYQLS